MRHSQNYKFSQVPVVQTPRSVFNRNHQYKTTFFAGHLVPFYVDEVLPGDTFNARVSLFARLATPIAALMDNLYLDVHFFYVPTRLVWTNWGKFCGEKDNPTDSTNYAVPTVTGVVTAGSLLDYMGLPVHGSAQTINALPLRVYNRIYNEWYRDQNLIPSEPMRTGDGPDQLADYGILIRAKRHDYFTSCLPAPQKGPGVMLPLGTTAPVKTTSVRQQTGAGDAVEFRKASDGTLPTVDKGLYFTGSGAQLATNANMGWTAGTAQPVYASNLYADLQNATAANINSLRQAFQIQHLLERDARGGTRYTEILYGHWGVVSPDFRLQRPEYLGGGTVPISINPVVQTSNSNPAGGVTPQGNVAGFGVGATRGIGFSKAFVEHGYVMGIISARADLTYQQGINRMWTRQTRYDFYWPALAHLGEQAVLNKEIYFQGTSADNDVFGYQERWAEYRYKPSLVTGLFRSGVTGTLDFWHLAQKFLSLPGLSPSFIEEEPPMARVKAVGGSPDFLLDSYFQVRCARAMPLYSVPGLVDHF